MSQGRIQSKGSKHKKRYTRPYIREMTLTDFMCQEKKGERGLANIEDSMEASIQRLKDYIKKRKSTDNIMTNRTTKTSQQKWIFQVTNWPNLIREDLVMTKKGKS